MQLADGSMFELTGPISGIYGFEDYKVKDITVSNDSYATVPQSAYTVEYANGRAEYFDGMGTIVGIMDKYGNKITLSHKILSSYTENAALPDYLRKIFYAETTIIDTNGDKYTISTNLSFGGATEGYIHIATPETDTFAPYVQYTTENSIDLATRYYRLTEKMDYAGRRLRYAYDNSAVTYYGYGVIHYQEMTEKTLFTGGRSLYTYESVFNNVSGKIPYRRVTSRCDMFLDDGGGDVTKYRHEKYTYSGEYTHPESGYSTRVTRLELDNVCYYKVHQFTDKNLLLQTATYVDNYMKELTSYQYYLDMLPQSITTYKYNSTKSLSIQSIESFTYNDYGSVLSHKLPNTGTVLYQYDDKYQMMTQKSSSNGAGLSVSETYELTSDKKSVASIKISENSAQKSQTDFKHDGYGNITETKAYIDATNFVTTTFVYNDTVHLSSKTTNGITEEFTYNKKGLVLTQKDGRGNVITSEYDGVGRLSKIINADKTFKTYKYETLKITETDERGYKSVYEYDTLGGLSIVRDDSNNAKETYAYDMGRRLWERTINKLYEGFDYDKLGRVIKYYKGMSNSTYTETYEIEEPYANNVARIKTTAASHGGVPDIVTAQYTDNCGRVIKQSIFNGSAEYTDTFEYDLFDNKTEELTAKNAEEGCAFTNQYTYDYAGRVVKVINADNKPFLTEYDWLGRKISQTDGNGGKAEYKYDALSRLTEEKIPLEANYYITKKYEYDNASNLTKEQKSNNETGKTDSFTRTDYAYNSRNFLTKMSMYDGDKVSETAEYEYDSAGNRTVMKTANGANITKYEYNNINQLVKLTDALGKTETYGYDNSFNMTSKTDRNGNKFTYGYDYLKRLLSVKATKADGTAATEFMTYAYSNTGIDLKLTETNENVNTTYKYDNMGRLTTQTDNNGIELRYTYDLAGNRKTFKLMQNTAQKQNISYDYDKLNRLTKVYEDGKLMATYTYDANGNRLSLAYGTGVTAATVGYVYNKANLVTNVTNKSAMLPGIGITSSFDYTYYTDGNQQTKTDDKGKKTTYTYDGLGRLASESIGGTGAAVLKNYTFDAAGNRDTISAMGAEVFARKYGYDKNNRLLTEFTNWGSKQTSAEYGYDNNGNCTNSKKQTTGESVISETSEYDVFNRMTKAVNATSTAQYAYRASGLRQSKTVNSEKTTHIWDGSNIVVELDGANAVKDSYLRGIGLLKSDNKGYYSFNGHGDVVSITDSFGLVNEEYDYDAFGVPVGTTEGDDNPFRYCGEYLDLETGTVYLRNRYYSPVVGRFLT